MVCNTQTCTGYTGDVLGYGTMQNQIKDFWLKSSSGWPFSWINFSEDSQHFGSTMWVGIELKTGAPHELAVANLRVFDCNGALIDAKPLYIPTGMTWAKWTFTCSFGQTCHYAVTRQDWGTGSLPGNPPPL